MSERPFDACAALPPPTPSRPRVPRFFPLLPAMPASPPFHPHAPVVPRGPPRRRRGPDFPGPTVGPPHGCRCASCFFSLSSLQSCRACAYVFDSFVCFFCVCVCVCVRTAWVLVMAHPSACVRVVRSKTRSCIGGVSATRGALCARVWCGGTTVGANPPSSLGGGGYTRARRGRWGGGQSAAVYSG